MFMGNVSEWLSSTDMTILIVCLGCVIVDQCVPMHVHLYVFVSFFACKCEAQIYFLAASLSDRKRGR